MDSPVALVTALASPAASVAVEVLLIPVLEIPVERRDTGERAVDAPVLAAPGTGRTGPLL